jgi:hypothetical protein
MSMAARAVNNKVAFINVTGYTKVVPITMKTLDPYMLEPQAQIFMVSNEYAWSGYNIVTYINDEGLQAIDYEYYTFNQPTVKHKDCLKLVEESRNTFIDAREHKKLIRAVWIGMPYMAEITDETLMSIAILYGGFKPRSK